MIRTDSPLYRLSAKLDRKQTVFVDGIVYSVEMADLAHSRLKDNLANNNPHHVSAVLDAWSMVDSLHRLRELLQEMPGLKQNSSTLQLFLRNTRQIEAMRHGVQHLRGEINTIVDQNRPIWGSLSWVTKTDPTSREISVGLLVAGTLSDYKGLPMVNPVGKQISPPIDLIELTAHGHSVSLSEIMKYVQRLVTTLEEELEQKTQNLPDTGDKTRIRLEL